MRYYIVLVFLILNTFSYSQKITDTLFKNVIEIADNNVTTNGKDFLFDISISPTTATPVVYVSAKVPLSLLSEIYPEFSRIIVISPNWKYYEEASGIKLPKGIICAEPTTSSIIYEFKRENGKSVKDSIVLMGSFPNMKIDSENIAVNNETEIYYSEGYGSVCCTRDPQWDIKPDRETFITNFEKENKIKIIDTYTEVTGKEGEANYYYTLNGLTNKLKLSFILKREAARNSKNILAENKKKPAIYTPTILTLNSRMTKS